MEATLFGFNATIVAKSFNPSIFRESWLVREAGLVDMQPGYVFTEQAVRVSCPRYTLVVVPQNLHFTPADDSQAQDVIQASLVPIVNSLMHTPFKAVGINFIWHLDPGEEPIATASRRLFHKPNSAFSCEFESADASFGAYMSKDLDNCRLKLDLKPVRTEQKKLIQCAFNYHQDVDGEGSASTIVSVLEEWQEFADISKRIATAIAGDNHNG